MKISDGNLKNKIDWNPLKKGGSSFKTHKLVEISSLRLEYKAGIGSIVFGLIFVIAGLGIFSVVFLEGFSILIALFGLIFAGAGGYMLKKVFEPIVFDKSEGYFWKGKVAPNQVTDIDELKTAAKLEDIYGIQVIKEYVKSRSSKGQNTSYYSYEINLVLTSGERLNVVDYGNATSILKDASTISRFLNKPVMVKPE